MQLFNLSFFSVPPALHEFLRQRWEIDNHLFAAMDNTVKVTHIRCFHGAAPEADGNEKYFRRRERFFDVPVSLLLYVWRKKPDAMLIHSFNHPLQTWFLSKVVRRSTKIIVQFHAEVPFRHPVKRWFQRKAFRRVNAFLFTAAEQAHPFVQARVVDPLRVHEMVEGSNTFSCSGDIPRERLITWVGRLDANKDPMLVLRAFSRLSEGELPFRLAMFFPAGGALESEVREFTASKGLQHRVDLRGFIRHSELENWFCRSEFFIAASHSESCGYALSEAMACGCIPVVSDIPSFSRMTDKGAAGFLFPAGDEDRLVEILRLLCDVRKTEMRGRVLRQFDEVLSFRAMAKVLETAVTPTTRE